MRMRTTLIAGPTASGKSRHAMELAERSNAVIINADSMQIYSVLEVLTARPGPLDTARIPHFLFGHTKPATPYSTGTWLREVQHLLDNVISADQPVIFVGGTGLYFRALTEGISPMPDIPPQIREKWRSFLTQQGSAEIHRILQGKDPETASRLRSTDGQRLVRAMEVLDASGRPISYWQTLRSKPLIESNAAHKLVLQPDRPELARRIAARFENMVETGAIEEVKQILKLNIDPAMPAMKAIGVREIASYLDGSITKQDAIILSSAATRQYAKRQMTWFRNQFGIDWKAIDV